MTKFEHTIIALARAALLNEYVTKTDAEKQEVILAAFQAAKILNILDEIRESGFSEEITLLYSVVNEARATSREDTASAAAMAKIPPLQ